MSKPRYVYALCPHVLLHLHHQIQETHPKLQRRHLQLIHMESKSGQLLFSNPKSRLANFKSQLAKLRSGAMISESQNQTPFSNYVIYPSNHCPRTYTLILSALANPTRIPRQSKQPRYGQL
jgi:hypothetical protein